MSEIQFTPEYIARQHKLLDRYLHDPRIAKFLAALDEIERLRSALEWYGDESHYDDEHAPVYRVGPYTEYDRGTKARAALSGGAK